MRIKFYALPIDEIRDETADAYSVYFKNPDPEVFDYLPGQYLTLKLNVGGEELRRCFSLSSCPVTDDRLSVTIKRVEDGRASNFIKDNLKAGDVVEVLPPMGSFTLTTNQELSRHHILIGAGSGITPLMSMLRSVLKDEPKSKVSLWYGNRSEDSIIFKNELVELGKQYGDRLHVYHTLSQPSEDWPGFTGRLDKDRIYELISNLFMNDELRKFYYVCGPNGLMEAAEAAFEKHAINPSDVHREYYSAPAPSDAKIQAANESEIPVKQSLSDGTEEYEIVEQTITMILDSETTALTVDPEKYILDSAIEANLDPPYACQSGICTTCRAFLHSGVVSMDETEGLSEEEINQGFILTCQAHPLTKDVEIEFK